jgi:hypothetical protein
VSRRVASAEPDRQADLPLRAPANTLIFAAQPRRPDMSKEKRSTKEKRKPKKEKPATPKK